MGRDRLTVSLEMDYALTRAHDITSLEVTDAARTMIAAADRLDELDARVPHHNPLADVQATMQFLEALLPGGFYDLAESQLAAALGLEFFEGYWRPDDFRVLCQHILREGD